MQKVFKFSLHRLLLKSCFQKVSGARGAEQHVRRSPADLLALLASGKRGGDEKLRLTFRVFLTVDTWKKLQVMFVHRPLYTSDRLLPHHVVQSQANQEKVQEAELPSSTTTSPSTRSTSEAPPTSKARPNSKHWQKGENDL